MDKKLDALDRDLDALVKKHGLKHSAFCATLPKGDFYGKVIGDAKDTVTASAAFESALNVGRLWQHTRGMVREALASFDRWAPGGKS